MADSLRLDRDGAVAILTLDHPSNRNALSSSMIVALAEHFGQIADDRDIRAVILAAEGPAFSAGHDMKEIQAHRGDADGGEAFFTSLFGASTRVFRLIRSLPQPVIAEVGGTAVAAGCQLVASCDLAVAADGARFGVNGIDAGFFCSTPGVPLARNVGRKTALELLLTGRLMDAEEARTAGLVNRVVPADRLRQSALELAHIVAARSAPVVALGKRVFHEQVDLTVDGAYAVALPAMIENLLLDDCAEGMEAFLAKRPPQWNRD